MKNLHVLSTDKPSRLFYNVGGALLFTNYENYNGVNIYITNDEEIKEGDWYIFPLYKKGFSIKRYNSVEHFSKEPCISLANLKAKKIILTTDQDLIKDGVQAIDDEFLEWFVENPSCEWVKILEAPKLVKMIDNEFYKIIIPKEEAKQETLEEVEEFKYYFENDIAMLECINEMESTGKVPKRWSWFLAKISELYKQQERMYSEEEVKSFLNSIISEIGLRKENIERNQDSMFIHLLEGGCMAFDSSIDIIKESFEKFKNK